MTIELQLTHLKNLDAQLKATQNDKEVAIQTVLTPEIKEQLKAIDDEFEPILGDIRQAIEDMEISIKMAVLKLGQTVKGEYTATFNKGRVSWDTKALDGYAAAHPEIEKFKKVGSPSVSIRRK